MNEIDILEEISEKLEKTGIEYMLTGSLAMNYYANPRMTRDIDIVVSLGVEDIDRVLKLFGTDYYISTEAVEEAIKYNSMFNIIHNESLVKVDFIIRKNEDYRKTEFKRKIKIKFDGFYTFIVSKEDLMISKLLWSKDSHSEMQIRDIKNLMKTGYDEQYLIYWLKELKLIDLFDRLKND
jgi:hypothetical protein